jgi:hypothetical protein
VKLDALLTATKGLGLRFHLVGLLPTAFVMLLTIALLASGAPGDAPDLDELSRRAVSLSGWEGTLLFGAVLVAALVLQPLQVSLVRLLEGYWSGSWLGRQFGRPGMKRHHHRRTALEDATLIHDEEPTDQQVAEATAATEQLRRLYGPEDPVLPTKLGNVLRAAEDRAGGRYGLETVVTWPRMYPLLSEPVRALVDDQRNQLDMSCRFCVAFVVAAAVSAGLLIAHGWWLAVAAGTLALAVLAYRAAVGAALSYGESLDTAYDLHRFDLLKALHLPLPATRSDELDANSELSAFLLQGDPVQFEYEHETAERGAGQPA